MPFITHIRAGHACQSWHHVAICMRYLNRTCICQRCGASTREANDFPFIDDCVGNGSGLAVRPNTSHLSRSVYEFLAWKQLTRTGLQFSCMVSYMAIRLSNRGLATCKGSSFANCVETAEVYHLWFNCCCKTSRIVSQWGCAFFILLLMHLPVAEVNGLVYSSTVYDTENQSDVRKVTWSFMRSGDHISTATWPLRVI
jgi:hypothetical protein